MARRSRSRLIIQKYENSARELFDEGSNWLAQEQQIVVVIVVVAAVVKEPLGNQIPTCCLIDGSCTQNVSRRPQQVASAGGL